MHLLSIPEPCSAFPPGEYLVEDRNAAELMLRCPGSTMAPFKAPCWDGDLDVAKKILLVATMGFGDAVLLTPCLRQIKIDHPQASLHIACFPEYRQVFLGLPYVDGFDEYPLPTKKLADYDCVLFLERAVEDNLLARTQHMTDRFAEHLGLILSTKTADLILNPDETQWARDSFPAHATRKRIGLQVQAGVRCRTYPQRQLGLLVNALAREDYEVYLMGAPGEFRADDGLHIHNLSRHGLTWRQSAAFLTTCDVFCGPDSSLLHAAGALAVPSVGLFGPFPWKLRTAYYPTVFALQGHEGCTAHPCFHSVHQGLPQFPLDQPCARSGKCEVLASILPERVLQKIEQVAAMVGPRAAKPPVVPLPAPLVESPAPPNPA